MCVSAAVNPIFGFTAVSVFEASNGREMDEETKDRSLREIMEGRASADSDIEQFKKTLGRRISVSLGSLPSLPCVGSRK